MMNEEIHTQNDFRLFLQHEFIKRCRKNPSYSLRAFARSLGIPASPLSAMLRGKRPITHKMKCKIGSAIGLSLEKIAEMSEPYPQITSHEEFQQLTLDCYSVISDWYHYAILELTRVQSFEPDVKFVAKTLSISQTEANIAIERLHRVGLLEFTADGKWRDTSIEGHATNINADLTSQASKKLQKQILEKSIKALEELPIEVRDHTSMTMAIDPRDLPQAKLMVKKFRRDLCMFFEKNKKPKHVYNLGISLYPVSKLEE